MNTVILGIRSLDESLESFRRACKTGKAETATRIDFATAELLWKVLTSKHWEIFKAMCGQVRFRSARLPGAWTVTSKRSMATCMRYRCQRT